MISWRLIRTLVALGLLLGKWEVPVPCHPVHLRRVYCGGHNHSCLGLRGGLVSSLLGGVEWRREHKKEMGDVNPRDSPEEEEDKELTKCVQLLPQFI